MPSDSHLDENGFVVLDIDAAGIAAHSHRAQIAACSLCDEDGYRGSSICDHRDHAAETVHGRAEAARVLAEIAARRASRARGPVPPSTGATGDPRSAASLARGATNTAETTIGTQTGDSE
jgi:hypothetical protein